MISDDNAGHRERLRQRFLRSGFDSFAEHEIIELLLTFCLPRKDVKPIAKSLLRKFKNIRGVFDADVDKLRTVQGIGNVAATGIVFVKHLMQKYFQENATEDHRDALNSYDQLGRFWQLRLAGLNYEVFEVAFLDTHLRLIEDGVKRISEGVVERTQISVRKIMEQALSKNAHAIIVAHNHPSGSPLPSEVDRLITQKIEKISETLGIRFIDHVIVGRSALYSLKKSSLFAFSE